MYKCSNCGKIFEEPKSIKEDWGEVFYVCPHCNGDYEEAHKCQKCEEWHTEDELYFGWCEKCLRETINYDTFFEYCEANKKDQYLDTFVMYEILNCEYVPMFSSLEFHELMVETYKKRVKTSEEYERMFGRKAKDCLLDRCIRFIMDDDGSVGRENYADWLNSKKEVK